MDPYREILANISLNNLIRIDAALEGNWNPTVSTIWTKKKGFISFDNVIHSDPDLKPSLELYFENHWIGLHCCKRVGNQNVFDETLALEIIEYLELRLQEKAGG